MSWQLGADADWVPQICWIQQRDYIKQDSFYLLLITSDFGWWKVM